MQIISLNVGQPQELTYGKRRFFTGGQKTPVPQAMLRTLDFDGDGQADLDNHGGPDRPVCVYSFDHYPYWENWLGEKLPPGAFSENLTLAGADETQICIGDTFTCGEALVQVSQPRLPCSKLAGKRGRKDLPNAIHANGYTGLYFRVLREGLVKTGDSVDLVTRHPGGVTVAFATQVMLKQRTDPADLRRLLAVPELSSGWHEAVSRRLDNLLQKHV